MAATSARDLLADTDLHPDEVGGDFAGESFRLGEAVASVHRTLADELGVAHRRRAVDAMSRPAGRRRRGPSRTWRRTPAGPRRPSARPARSRSTMQRVHGDLHLGQVLRTPAGVAADRLRGRAGAAGRGAPAARLAAARRRGHAALVRVRRLPAAGRSGRRRREARPARAREWIDRNQDAFCDGYADVAGFDPREHGQAAGARTSWTRRSTRRPTRRGTGRAGCASR